MKLYQYDDIRKFNQAISSFNRSALPIIQTNILVVDNKLQFFVMTDPKEDYLPKVKVESKIEDEVKKTLKVKKEIEPKMPNPKNITEKPKVDLSNEVKKGGKVEVIKE